MFGSQDEQGRNLEKNKQTNPKRKPKVRALSLVFVPLLKERSRAEDYMGKATCTYI